MKIYNYLQYRMRELPIWLGIPIIGVCSTSSALSWSRFSLFLIAITFFMSHILLFNDWGGLQRNPEEKKRYPLNESVDNLTYWLLWGALITFIISAVLYFLIKPRLCLLVTFGTLLNILYSHPLLNFKEKPLASKWIHLWGGEAQFLLGYLVFSSNLGAGVLIGLFFALIFMSGHFIHECVDSSVDEYGQIITFATRFGLRPTLFLALSSFVVSHIYSFALWIYGTIPNTIFFIFLPPLGVHIFFLLKSYRTSSTMTIEKIKLYRQIYRCIYGCCTIIFFLFRFLQ